MSVEIEESEAPITTSILDDLESRLRIKLPEDYRAFLLRNNGGRPSATRFDFVESGRRETSSVHFFLAVYQGRYDNFEQTFLTFKVRATRMPKELIPIGSDQGGNKICLTIEGPNKGAVYFWDHENEADEGEEPTLDNCHMIKPSLQEFLDSLY